MVTPTFDVCVLIVYVVVGMPHVSRGGGDVGVGERDGEGGGGGRLLLGRQHPRHVQLLGDGLHRGRHYLRPGRVSLYTPHSTYWRYHSYFQSQQRTSNILENHLRWKILCKKIFRNLFIFLWMFIFKMQNNLQIHLFNLNHSTSALVHQTKDIYHPTTLVTLMY